MTDVSFCTVSRVRTHIAISFMAFACIRQLMYRIKRQHKALSPEVIRNALIHVQHSVFKHKRTKKSYIKSCLLKSIQKQKNLCCDGIKDDYHSLPTLLIDIFLKYLNQ